MTVRTNKVLIDSRLRLIFVICAKRFFSWEGVLGETFLLLIRIILDLKKINVMFEFGSARVVAK